MSELKVEIRKGDKVLKIVTFRDPRPYYCEQFNAKEGMRVLGIQAYPVSSDTRRARSKSREA